MKKNKDITYFLTIFFFVFTFSLGCQKQDPETYKEYLEWLNDPENGFFKERRVWGIVYKVRFLPTDYILLKDLKESVNDVMSIDNLIAIYDSSLTFMLTIGPKNESEEKLDLFMNGVKDINEFKERVELLSFNMAEQVKLKTGNLIIKPVLYNYENIYGLKPDRDFIFVFTPECQSQEEFYNSDTLDFVYEDKIFGTGIHHFIFSRSNISKRPLLIKIKNQINL